MKVRARTWVALGFISAICANPAFSAPVPAGPTLPKADAAWELMGNNDGVLVHKKEVAGSDLVAFRGERVIDAPIEKVASVLIDTPRKLEWVAKIAEAKDIRPIGPYERIEYNATLSGFFLVRDRDFVFHAKAELNREKGQMIFGIKSVEDPAMPETDRVRGHLDRSQYVLTRVGDGSKTHVVVEIHADPKGSVPKWLVNLFQKAWPTNTLNGIAKQVAKADVKANAGVAEYFKGAPTATLPVIAGEKVASK